MRLAPAMISIAAGLALSCAPAAPDGSTESSQTEAQRVLATEDAYVAAEINRDEAALRRLVDDRFTRNSSNGTTADKEALIQSLLGMHMTGQTITERTVLVDGNLAVTFGTAEIRVQAPGENESAVVLRYTTTYVKRETEWRMLALHMSPRSPR